MTTYSFQLYGAGSYGLATAFNAILLLITMVAGIMIVRGMSKKGVA
jgi:ABC-type Fe3+ transport system permease subunit